MKRWSTSWGRPRPELRAALCLVLLLGCVGRGTHLAALAERDQLAAEVRVLREKGQLLEASNESLSQERLDLIASVEDLGQERQALEASLVELEAQRAELAESLNSHQVALAREEEEVDRLRKTYDGLVSDLQSEVVAGRVEIEQLREGLRVNLAQEILFPLGSAQLNAEGERLLGAVASRLSGLSQRIQVQGHTDGLAIHGRLADRFASNWELGGARASQVVRLFEARGIAGERLEATSFGATRPVASNETAEGRARNRRIEIRLLAHDEAASAAAAGSAAPEESAPAEPGEPEPAAPPEGSPEAPASPQGATPPERPRALPAAPEAATP